MAILGQGAPGVRIQLRDLSQIDLVTEPIVTGGVVGFSSRGEFNKIIDITSTSDMDVILGSGFNNPQFNQGLYAARAVVQSGGFVEFVRPFGEEIIEDDNDSEYAYNQQLKTDTYLVEYNFTTPDDPTPENIPDSFSTTYMASTRYIQDSLQGLGEREIYTISETIQKNTNVNFYLDTDETLVQDTDTVSLFAIMNSDPTAARRAGDRFDISSITVNGGNIDVTTKNIHGLSLGDEIFITGTTGFNGQFAVSEVIGAKKFRYADATNTSLPESDGAVYINQDTIQSGVDFLEVKTAARGKASKQVGTFILEDIPLDLTAGSVVSADVGSDTLVTVTAVAHGLETDDSISVEGANVLAADGIYEITVIDPDTFTYTITGQTLAATVTSLYFTVLGNEIFTVLLSDGTKVLNEYTVEGQDAISTLEDGEIGPVGIPVVKSNVTIVPDEFDNTDLGIVFDTFDATAVNTTSNEVFPVNIGNFTAGDTVYIAGSTLPDFTPVYSTGEYTVDVVTGLGMTLIDSDGVTPVTFTAVGTDVAATCNNVTNTFIKPAGTNSYTVGDEISIAVVGAGTLPTTIAGALSGTYYVAAVNGDEISLFESDGTTPTLMVADGVGTSTSVNVTTGGQEITVADGGKFNVGDTVTFQVNAPAPFAVGTDYVVASVNGKLLQLNSIAGVAITPNIPFTDYSNLVNMTGTNRVMINNWVDAGLNNIIVRSTFNGATGVTVGSNLVVVSDASRFSIGDQVRFSDIFDENGLTELPTGIDDTETYIVSSIDLMGNIVGFAGLVVTAVNAGRFQITNLTQTQGGTGYIDPGMNDGKQVNFIGVLGLKIPAIVQDEDIFKFFSFVPSVTPSSGDVTNGVLTFGPTVKLAETTNDIMLDSSVGRTFLSLGLANEDYVDTDFDGDDERVFRLTEDGFQAARFFLFCEYFFAGQSYNFAGTILPFVANDINLYIGNSAGDVANGWTFQVNQNASLQAASADSGFDLSQSVKDGVITSEFAQIAFNAEDPAIINDAIWEYSPINNRNSSTLAEAWNLFLDRDSANADMLISAGTTIRNLFVRGFEDIEYNVMDSMLNVCEKRKDMFSIFDGIDAPDINVALRKMVGIGSQGEISRWGGIFDGRDIFFDSNYTKLNVQSVKSISVAAIITLNRAGNVYWLPPAGYTTGRIPIQYSLRQKFLRSYNYAADPSSDIARLYDANINPTRVNDQGQFIYGQKTMLKRGSALNRMNVIMLIAGIHKRFETYLDTKVFQLNTAALRNNIQSDLQAQLELIKASNPQGITAGQVICDTTNNTPDIIDTNQLIVDVVIQPTRAAEFITLRTTVQRTGADLDVTNTIIGG